MLDNYGTRRTILNSNGVRKAIFSTIVELKNYFSTIMELEELFSTIAAFDESSILAIHNILLTLEHHSSLANDYAEFSFF
jgi:hypothetical protein